MSRPNEVIFLMRAAKRQVDLGAILDRQGKVHEATRAFRTAEGKLLEARKAAMRLGAFDRDAALPQVSKALISLRQSGLPSGMAGLGAADTTAYYPRTYSPLLWAAGAVAAVVALAAVARRRRRK